MSVSGDDVTGPGGQPPKPRSGSQQEQSSPFSQEELLGVHDYWTVYERHYDEIRAILLADLADDEEIGDIIRRTPHEVLNEQGRLSRELTRRAIFDGEWDAYLAHLRSQGATYANAGLSFSAWFRVTSALRPHVVRHLLAAYAVDTRRLIQAVAGMDRLIGLALSAIGDAYLAAKEKVLARQRETIILHDRSSSSSS